MLLRKKFISLFVVLAAVMAVSACVAVTNVTDDVNAGRATDAEITSSPLSGYVD